MKRLPLTLLILLVGSASTAAIAKDRLMTGFPDLPKDAREVAERYVGCVYFTGEITGTDSQRDADISQSMRNLRCSIVERDLGKIKHRYRHNQTILKILQEAEIGG